MLRNRFCTSLIISAIFCGTPAHAAKDVEGARSLGVGGALRATASGASAIPLNPAGMSLTRAYSLAGFYHYRSADSANLVHASVVDSVTTRLAAGVGYSYSRSVPRLTLTDNGKLAQWESSHVAHEVALATSYPLGDVAILGLTTKYINYQAEAPPGQTPVSLSNVSMDAGLIGRLGKYVNVAVTGYNLIGVHDQLYPREMGLGASFTTGQILTLTFDSVLDFSSDPKKMTASFHGGGELFFADAYALRGGAAHSLLRDATYVTAGLGVISKKASLEFAWRQKVNGGSETLIAFSLQAFFDWGSGAAAPGDE